MLLNADLGESWYDTTVGDDEQLMPHLDLCNLACGFHGGDARTQRRTIELAVRHDVRIGAHPSFPDRRSFGRREMALPAAHLLDLLLYQVGGLQAVARYANQDLHHLKPHGALYHYANRHPRAASAVIETALQLGIPRVVGPPRGELRTTTEGAGLTFLAEGFADRAYAPDLRLRSRSLPGAELSAPAAVTERVRQLLSGQVTATDGRTYPLRVATICLHGDHPGAGERARAVKALLDAQ